MTKLFSIDPKVFASIKDFDWAIRSLAQGSRVGKRLSRKTGQGMEFSQYRPYSQGDDLRQLDWKMYARSEKFYVKQSEVETNISVTFVIDDSTSMNYHENNLTKWDAARLLSGVLAHIALENGDKVGFAGDPGLKSGFGDRHWQRLLFYLQNLSQKKKFEQPWIENIRSRELFVVISDLYDENNEWTEFIKKLKSPKNEVIVFHLLGKQEKSLELEGAIRFEDLESGKVVESNPETLRSQYQSQMNSWIETTDSLMRNHGIDYMLFSFTDPVQDLVNTFLNHRKRLL